MQSTFKIPLNNRQPTFNSCRLNKYEKKSMWKSGLGEKLIYSTQKLTKSKKKKDNSVPIIILMLSSVSIRLMKNSRTT